ncbi:DUF1064 domain-containing protein [Acinetobacter pullicarnis]|uniref:DUF1064 domain-containing protein n=1 Tax=Acinetobacter pullicarnis TaxID=2576829 RepID=UPI001123B131|nr:DUF1064 domain-containing protein [Acinetobacter pullicarnis]
MTRPKRPKYANKKVVLNGTAFDSKKEARRFGELQILERAGEIKDLQTQYAFVLAESVKFNSEPRSKPAVKYLADFVYVRDGRVVVEDVKSAATKKLAVYRLKKHLMKSVHGIEVVEI